MTKVSDNIAPLIDELGDIGKHGHYETMFRVVREEVERDGTAVRAGRER